MTRVAALDKSGRPADVSVGKHVVLLCQMIFNVSESMPTLAH